MEENKQKPGLRTVYECTPNSDEQGLSLRGVCVILPKIETIRPKDKEKAEITLFSFTLTANDRLYRCIHYYKPDEKHEVPNFTFGSTLSLRVLSVVSKDYGRDNTVYV